MKKLVIVIVIVAALGVAVLLALGLLASTAVPELERARRRANEASVVGTLRTITIGQATYAMACGAGFYAPSLTNLGAAPTGMAGGFLPEEMTKADAFTRSGYVITMGSTSGKAGAAPASCNGLPAGTMVSGFWVTATPVSAETGTVAFATNTEGTIWFAEQQTPIRISDTGQPAGTTAYR